MSTISAHRNTETLIRAALVEGALDAVTFAIDDIVFDPRTLLKCMFGCPDYGYRHTCPSSERSLTLDQYERTLKRYRWGIIIRAREKNLCQRITLATEQRAFRLGHYFAMSFSDCGLCQECRGFSDLPCAFPEQARPAFHSVGIDVFRTVRRLGLPVDVLLTEDAEANWYGAVFVE